MKKLINRLKKTTLTTIAFVLVLTSVTYTAMDVSASSMSVQEMEVKFSEQVLIESEKMLGRTTYRLSSPWYGGSTGYDDHATKKLVTECNGFVRRVLVNTVYALEARYGTALTNLPEWKAYQGLKQVTSNGLDMSGHIRTISKQVSGRSTADTPKNVKYPNGSPNMNVLGPWLTENLNPGGVVFFEAPGPKYHWGIYAGTNEKGVHEVYHNTRRGATKDPITIMWYGKGAGAYQFDRFYATGEWQPLKGDAELIKEGNNSEKLKDVQFTLYNATTDIAYKSYTNVKTNAQGKLEFKELDPGDYYVKETYNPHGYLYDTAKKYLFTVEADKTTKINGGTAIKNIKPEGIIHITKKARGENTKVPDTTFEVRNSKNALVDTVTTGTNGVASTKRLPLGTYTITETKVPGNYLLDKTPMKATLAYVNNTTPVVNVYVTQENERYVGRIKVVKQGMSGEFVEGTIFDVETSDGKLITTVKTNKKGEAFTGELDLGTTGKASFNVIEREVPMPYILDETPMPVHFDAVADGKTEKVINKSVTQKNNAPVGNIQITKQGPGGEKVQGAKYNINNASGQTVDTVTTGVNGIAKTKNLPLGNYTVVEIAVPVPYYVDPKPIYTSINYHNPNTMVTTTEVTQTNKLMPVRIEVTKTGPKGEVVEGTIFDVLDSNGDYVTTLRTGRNGKAMTGDLPTDARGNVNYTVKEVYVPSPYILDETPIKVTGKATSNSSNHFVIRVAQKNDSPAGELTITKLGKVTEGATASKLVPGTKYVIKDASGKQVGPEVATNAQGKVVVKDLPLGNYTVTETFVPAPYVLDKKPIKVELAYSGSEVKVVKVGIEQVNVEAQGRVEIQKLGLTDAGEVNVAGAKFDILDSTGKKVDTVTTLSDGKGISEYLPLGKYTVKEVYVPRPYYIDDKTATQTVELKYKDQNTPVVTYSATFENKEVTGRIELTKHSEVYGADKRNLIEGAQFVVTNAQNKVMEVVTTDKTGKAITQNLPLGIYTVKEVYVPGHGDVGPYVLDDTTHVVELMYKDHKTPVVVEKRTIENKFKRVLELGIEKIRIDTQTVADGLDVEVWFDGKQNYKYDVNDFGETGIKVTLMNSHGVTIVDEVIKAKDFFRDVSNIVLGESFEDVKKTFKVPARFLDNGVSNSEEYVDNFTIKLSLADPQEANKVRINKPEINTDGHTAKNTIITVPAGDSIELPEQRKVIRTERYYGQAMREYYEYLEINVPNYNQLRAGRGYGYHAFINYRTDLPDLVENAGVSIIPLPVVTADKRLVDVINDDNYNQKDGNVEIKLTLDKDLNRYVPPKLYAKKDIKGTVISQSDYDKLTKAEQDGYRDGGNQILTPMWSTELGKHQLKMTTNKIGMNRVGIEVEDTIDLYAYMYAWFDEGKRSETFELDETIVSPVTTTDRNKNDILDIWENNLMPDNWGVTLDSGEKILTSVEKKFFGLTGDMTLSYMMNNGTFEVKDAATDPEGNIADLIEIRKFGAQEVKPGTYTIPTKEPVRLDYIFVGWEDIADQKVYAPGGTINITRDTVLKAKWEYDAELTIDIKDEEGNRLSNVNFEFSVDGESWKPYTTDSSGEVFIDDLRVGTHYMRFKTVPSPYVLDKTQIAIKVEEGQPTKFTHTLIRSRGNLIIKESGRQSTDPTAPVPEVDGEYAVYIGKAPNNDVTTLELLTYVKAGEPLPLEIGDYTIEQQSVASPYLLHEGKDKAMVLTVPYNPDATMTTFSMNFKMNERTYLAVFDTADSPDKYAPKLYKHGERTYAPKAPSRDGYVFLGWTGGLDNPDGVVMTRDYIFKALWQQTHFKVTFLGDDGEVLKQQTGIPLGESATAPDLPEIEGKEFVRWDTTFSNVTKDLEVRAIYASEVHTVTFRGVEGTDGVFTTIRIEHGGTAELPPEISTDREGYTFIGWDQSLTNVTEDLVVHALYDLNSYKVEFKMPDGSVIDTQEIDHGGRAVAPTAPKLEGHTFSEWDKTYSNITGNLVVNAVYEANLYTVTFLGQDGGILYTETVAHGQTAKGPNAELLKVPGYDFISWDYTLENITAPVTFKPIYEVEHYTVTFIADGTVIEEQRVAYGNNAVAPAAPLKEGHTFTGWLGEMETVIEDREINAGYDINTYTVTFRTADDKVYDTQHLEYGSLIPFPDDAPTILGYKLVRWGKEGETIVAGNMDIYPEYTPELYPVHIYDEDMRPLKDLYGNVYNLDYELTYGEGVEVPDFEPHIEGKLFNSWVDFTDPENKEPFRGVTSGRTIIATFDDADYQAVYLKYAGDEGWDADTVILEDLKYGDVITLNQPEPKAGIDGDFIGWVINDTLGYEKDSEGNMIPIIEEKLLQRGDTYVIKGNTWITAAWETDVEYLDDFGQVLRTDRVRYADTIEPPTDLESGGEVVTTWERVEPTDPETWVDEEGKPLSQYLILGKTQYKPTAEGSENRTAAKSTTRTKTKFEVKVPFEGTPQLGAELLLEVSHTGQYIEKVDYTIRLQAGNTITLKALEAAGNKYVINYAGQVIEKPYTYDFTDDHNTEVDFTRVREVKGELLVGKENTGDLDEFELVMYFEDVLGEQVVEHIRLPIKVKVE